MDKEAMKERLRQRLAESKAERERELVHPRECACGGHGRVPRSQFAIGYVPCEARR